VLKFVQLLAKFSLCADNQSMAPDFSYVRSVGDAYIDFFLSPDAMTLTADFYPANAGRLHLVESEVVWFLTSKGITHGLNKRNLQEAIYECNTTYKVLKEVVIAQGTPPKKEVPAYWRLEPGLFQEQHHDEKQKIDYKEMSPFIIVHANQLLARAVAPVPGELGYNVRGEAIPYGKKDIVKLLPGNNTFISHGSAYAKISGRLVQEKSYFHVVDFLELEEVGYATGHIQFPGHVLIRKGVLEGFRVWVGQDLRVYSTLDASDVFVHENLEVKGGILGRFRGLVRVGKDLNADFVENAKVEVLGSVFLRKHILHSEVAVKGDLTTGENSKVITSLLMVKGNCELWEVGTPNAAAKVVVGVDFVVKRKFDTVQLSILNLQNQRNALRIIANPDEKTRQRLAQIERELEILVEKMNALNHEMIKPDSKLIARGHIYPSSIIELGHVSMQVKETLHNKMFRLSEDGKNLIIESITPEKK
jgi:uncharacterized protein (DUF342 family)